MQSWFQTKEGRKALPELGQGKIICFGFVSRSMVLSDHGEVYFISHGVTARIQSIVLCLESQHRTKEELIEKVWGYTYVPLRHDSLVYSTISKIRNLLGPKGHWIELSEAGYRLAPGVRVVVIEKPVGAVSMDTKPDFLNRSLSRLQELNLRQLAALRRLEQHAYLDTASYRELYDVSRATAARDLTQLYALSLVKRAGRGRATKYFTNSPQSDLQSPNEK